MRLLVVAAISMSMLMLIPGAFAQSNSSSPRSNQHDRAVEAKRNIADLEKARLLNALRDSTYRLQAQSQELDKLNQQLETPGPKPSIAQQDVEHQHPEWYKESNTYRPCPWNMCPSPP
jgi:hypothetical protein